MFFYDIRGSIQMLNNQKLKAYSSFNKSLSLNPDNADTLMAVQTLEKEIKGAKK